MITRYEIPEMAQIWREESRFKRMLAVEVALLKALEEKKVIPANVADAFKDVQIDVARIQEIEAITRHDIIAFCTCITEQVEEDKGRYFHFGVTSSDIIDTAQTLQMKDSITLLITEMEALISELKKRVDETKELLTLGRSHGMAAEPMIFGQKFLSFQVELQRRVRDYKEMIERELTGQLSGAVGNYTVIDLAVEKLALEKLNLKVEPVSSQVIPRDHIAKIVGIGALTAVALERMAVEFRLLHHSDVNELHEGFKAGQKGSSTMPHKRNPISSENITGISRVIRSHHALAIENCVLWHERDISHSSAERIFLPDHFGLLLYATRRMKNTVADLVLHEEHIQAKAMRQFTALSSAIMHRMLPMNNVARGVIYSIIQKASFESESSDDFYGKIEAEAKAQNLKVPEKINEVWLRDLYISRFADVIKRTQ